MSASGRGPQMTEEEALELQKARERMLARHKLIEGMIHNNELQQRNESARNGAEIERAVALRDAALPSAGKTQQDEVTRTTERLAVLEKEHQRLVAEREWLNTSLQEFDSGPSANEHQRAGHS